MAGTEPTNGRSPRHELGFLDALIEHAPMGLALVDRDMRYIRINDSLAAINGLPADDHIGKTPADVVPELAPLIEEVLTQVMEERKPILGMDITGPTPAQPDPDRFFQASFYPVFDGDEVIGVAGIIVELTRSVLAERTLHDQAAHIYEDVVQRLAVAQMAIETEHIDKAYENVKDALASAKRVASGILLQDRGGGA
jgi:PAS domain S-box-containing protein